MDVSAAFVAEDSPTLSVEPADALFEELGKNTYDFRDLLSELIDNAIAARVHDQGLEVVVELHVSESDPRQNHIIVRDNASGIPVDALGDAISPAAVQGTGSLNEHGLGMKQAIAAMGTLRYLITKTAEDEHAHLVEQFRFGPFVPKSIAVPWSRGTEICVGPLKPITRTTALSFSRDTVPYLGARYREFLRPENPEASIQVLMFDFDNDDAEVHRWDVVEVKPVYFHPKTRMNAPVIDHKVFRGPGWRADLVFGYSPVDHEWGELGLKQPSRFDPYAVSLSKQGLDVLMNRRVIIFHQLPELGLTNARHNQYNHIRGEIHLLDGFSTAITKNALIQDSHLQECLSQIAEFLTKGDYLKGATYPTAIPEAALRDRLANWLTTNQIAPRKEVQTEYVVGGLDGHIDILADGEAWELKRDEASGQDVYQLFAYMDMGEFGQGLNRPGEVGDSRP